MQFSYGLYNELLKIRISVLYLLAFSALFAMSGTWWYFWYQPSKRVTNQLQEEVHALYSQMDELKKIEKNFAGISQAIDACKVDVQKKSVMKYRNQQRQQSLSLVVDCATDSGINVGACRLLDQRDESWCSINTLSGEFKGSLDQVIAFFDALKKTKQIIEISGYELMHTAGESFTLHANFAVYSV